MFEHHLFLFTYLKIADLMFNEDRIDYIDMRNFGGSLINLDELLEIGLYVN